MHGRVSVPSLSEPAQPGKIQVLLAFVPPPARGGADERDELVELYGFPGFFSPRAGPEPLIFITAKKHSVTLAMSSSSSISAKLTSG